MKLKISSTLERNWFRIGMNVMVCFKPFWLNEKDLYMFFYQSVTQTYICNSCCIVSYSNSVSYCKLKYYAPWENEPFPVTCLPLKEFPHLLSFLQSTVSIFFPPVFCFKFSSLACPILFITNSLKRPVKWAALGHCSHPNGGCCAHQTHLRGRWV